MRYDTSSKRCWIYFVSSSKKYTALLGNRTNVFYIDKISVILSSYYSTNSFSLTTFWKIFKKADPSNTDKLADSAGVASEYIFAATTVQTNSCKYKHKEYGNIIEDSYLKSKRRVLVNLLWFSYYHFSFFAISLLFGQDSKTLRVAIFQLVNYFNFAFIH